MMIAPAAFIRSTTMASAGAMKSLNSGEPRVKGIPFTGMLSFTACGKPCIQPRYSPRANCASRSLASASNASRGGIEMMAFT